MKLTGSQSYVETYILSSGLFLFYNYTYLLPFLFADITTAGYEARGKS